MKAKVTKPRSTTQKRLDKIKGPRARLVALLNENRNVTNVRRDAELFVGRWQAVLALMRLDDQAGLESSKTDAAISEAWKQSADALSTALAKWDAKFFEDVAKEMRCAASARQLDNRLALVQIAMATGGTPSEVAAKLTNGKTNTSFQSMVRTVRKDFARFRRADK